MLDVKFNMSSSKTVLHAGTEEEVECHAYRRNVFKTFLAYLSLLLGGIPYLLARWKPTWRVALTCSRCPLSRADRVILKHVRSGEVSLEPVLEKDILPGDFPEKYVVDKSTPGHETSDTSRLVVDQKQVFRYFVYKFNRYVWNNESESFTELRGYDVETPVSKFFSSLSSGLSTERSSALLQLYGANNITVEVPSYLSLLVKECLHPFYIFQLCSITLWSLDEYVFYASCIFIISLLSLTVSLYETRRQAEALHEMVSGGTQDTSTIVRPDGEDEVVENSNLVPGDLVAIPPNGCIMSCDMVLVTGTAIVNESMLTGESVPVTKSCLPQLDVANDETYSPEMHRRHTIFAGTQVIQTRYYGEHRVLAVVVTTGFSTAKGELVRSILCPKPIGFKFYQDSIRFIFVLFGMASIGMAYVVYVYIQRGSPIKMILLRTLDIITIVVPPALPAAMTVGTVYAQARLKKQGIFCISPSRINICGKLKLVCFDKTGTLTEDGLDMWGLIPTKNASFEEVVKDVSSLEERSPVMWSLASCHSLTSINQQLTGDPLDVKMFESTLWQLEESGGDNQKFDKMMPTVVKPPETGIKVDSLPLELGIIRQLTFSSSLARMSVVTRELGAQHFQVFTKGAPEKIEELCRGETIPIDFKSKLQELTMSGFRVIGLATKDLNRDISWTKVNKMKRPELETDLTFLGFLVMQNMLKPQTSQVLTELTNAATRCLMVTGDNLLTAVSVARDCGMVGKGDRVVITEASYSQGKAHVHFENAEGSTESKDDSSSSNDSAVVVPLEPKCHLAVTGKSWEIIKQHFPEMFPKLLVQCTVFARMAPEQKADLVENLQALGYTVAMCGDGANDCGALKAAHVGVSLSEAEASVAAPFTSKIPNISCMPTLIREGRCALVTSFGVFKYMALYSFIQFISVLILYTNKTNLGDTQFLYIDLVITTTVAVLMGRTAAHKTLAPSRPPGSLMSGVTLLSIFAQILVCLTAQLAATFYLQSRDWYTPLEPKDASTEIVQSWDTTTIFLVSSFQYLTLATVFSRGPPFRRPFYTNTLYLLALVFLSAFTAMLLAFPPAMFPPAIFFQLMPNPSGIGSQLLRWQFRLAVGVIIVVNTSVNIFVELSVSSGSWVKHLSHFLTRKKRPRNKYKLIKEDLEVYHPGWPRDGAKYYADVFS